MTQAFADPSCTILSLARGQFIASPTMASLGVFRLPSDPIGTTTVTFDGVHAGSEIRVQLPDGSEAAGVETCDDNHALTWSVYATGSSNNTMRIVIVHTASKLKEFTYTSRIGAQSIPDQQEPDKWYSNPA